MRNLTIMLFSAQDDLEFSWHLLSRIALYSFRSIKLSVWRWICTATTSRHTWLPISRATWKPISSRICIYCPSRKQEYEHCDFQKTVHVMIIPPFLLESSALWATEYSSVITWFPMTYNVQRTTYDQTYSYRLKDMVEQFDAKPAEIRALFNNQLDPARTAELRDRMLAVGLPI